MIPFLSKSRQSVSSSPWGQSLTPLHLDADDTHTVGDDKWHENAVNGHEPPLQFSSEPSEQSRRPSQTKYHDIHVPVDAHCNKYK